MGSADGVDHSPPAKPTAPNPITSTAAITLGSDGRVRRPFALGIRGLSTEGAAMGRAACAPRLR